MDNCRGFLVRYESYLHNWTAFRLLALILWATDRVSK